MSHILTDWSMPARSWPNSSDVGGSAQFTDPVSARAVYRTDEEDSPFFVRDVYAYGVARDAQGNDLDNMKREDGDVADYRVEIMLLETYCTTSKTLAPLRSLPTSSTRRATVGTYPSAPDEDELRAVLSGYWTRAWSRRRSDAGTRRIHRCRPHTAMSDPEEGVRERARQLLRVPAEARRPSKPSCLS